MPDVRFSVCALGDTSYEKFCQTGKDIDARLETLGATRVADRQDCDVDYEDAFAAGSIARSPRWLRLHAGDRKRGVPGSSGDVEYGKKTSVSRRVAGGGASQWRRDRPRKPFILELSLAGSGMTYEPGDALAVVPVNAPDVVQAILDAAKLSGNEESRSRNRSAARRLADALREDFDITALSRNVLAQTRRGHRIRAHSRPCSPRMRRTTSRSLSTGREIVDAIQEFAPVGLVRRCALAGIFRKLPPRLYSIASSPLAHPG